MGSIARRAARLRSAFGAFLALVIALAAAAPVAAVTASSTSLLVWNVDSGGFVDPDWVDVRVTVSPPTAEVSTVTLTDDLDAAVSIPLSYPANVANKSFEITGLLAPGPHALRASFAGTTALSPSTSAAASFTLLAPTTTSASITELGNRAFRVDMTVTPAPTPGNPVDIREQGSIVASGVMGEGGQASLEFTVDDDVAHTVTARSAMDEALGLASSSSEPLVARGQLWSLLLVPAASPRTVGYSIPFFACIQSPEYSWSYPSPVELVELNGEVETLVAGQDVGFAPDYDDCPVEEYPNSYFAVRFDVTFETTGTHTLAARFLGDDSFSPAASAPVSINVLADTAVDLDAYAASPPTFHPVKDGYRDTTRLSWSAGEQLLATTDVYDSAGSRVRRLGTMSGTSGAVIWNGRRSDGTLLPAGTYRFRTTFRDQLGNSRIKTASVTLTHKKLELRTATFYRNGEDFSYGWRYGDALVLRSESEWSTGVWLDSGQGGSGWNQARVFYEFRLPSAVSYKTIKWSVLGRNLAGRGSFAIWQYSSDWFDPLAQVNAGYAWSTVSAPANTRTNGRYATGVVIANGYYNSIFDVRQVKLVVTYYVLA